MLRTTILLGFACMKFIITQQWIWSFASTASGALDKTAKNLNSDQKQQINVMYDLFQLNGRMLFPSTEPPPPVGLPWDYKVSCGKAWNWSPLTFDVGNRRDETHT